MPDKITCPRCGAEKSPAEICSCATPEEIAHWTAMMLPQRELTEAEQRAAFDIEMTDVKEQRGLV